MATTSTHQRKPGKRGKVTGWSPGAARRNVAFLRSVDETTLDGLGLALTLTVRDCPSTASDWSSSLKSWVERQRRAGMIRLHWVMEFQRRGVPHLHVAAWYDPDRIATDDLSKSLSGFPAVQGRDPAWTENHRFAGILAVADWVDITGKFGTGSKGQHARPIADEVGWFMYLAKHCGRGRKHYQRQQDNLPAAWKSSPRVWGKSGTWETIDPADATLTRRQWYTLRRLVRRQRVARARASLPGQGWTWEAHTPLLTRPQLREAPVGVLGSGRPLKLLLDNLKHARSMLKCPDRKLSEVRGISEWIDQDMQQQLIRALGSAAAEHCE